MNFHDCGISQKTEPVLDKKLSVEVIQAKLEHYEGQYKKNTLNT